MRILICSAIIIILSFGEDKYDKTLEQLCTRHGGKFQKRIPDTLGSGDSCVAALDVPTNDNEEAFRMCRMWFAYHIKNARILSEYQTECEIVSYTICTNPKNPKYSAKMIQIRGTCYSLVTSTPTTDSSARNKCQKLGARIMKVKSNEVVRFLKAFYPNVQKIWVDQSDHGISTNEILAFGATSFMHNIRGMPIISAGNMDSADTVCEFTPPRTIGDIIPSIPLYNEIYYPIDITKSSLILRSTSFYGIMYRNKLHREDERCQSIMKFLGINAVEKESIDHTFLKDMSEALLSSLIVSHFKARRMHWRDCVNQENDVQYHVKGLDRFAIVPGNNEWECDSKRTAVAIYSWLSTGPLVRPVSDAATGPIFCSTFVPRSGTTTCTDEYKMYTRDSGERVCYRGYGHGYQEYDYAKNFCALEGAKLAGFESIAELNFFTTLYYRFWVNAKRRRECDEYVKPAYNTADHSHPCSKRNIFQWQDGVASNNNSVLYKAFAYNKPSFYYQDEYCLEYGWKAYALTPVTCTQSFEWICQRPPLYRFPF